ncbi:uncharacterized protein UTRI_05686_B [Ustilago trichophora]|uniref:LYC1 C-terminal domain-containing protein n=1 Tax=Ustilago trichophora TaxID=86804 RepID=A0A5C3EQ72_9BASI|nr:uncharacterized protein UTRI_05686_B [Ustilago trichophora]
MTTGYVLVPATEAQDQIATEREWVEWGQPLLTLDQFVTREKVILGTSDFSTTRRQRWVLVPADDTTTTDFLSACETYRRPILIKRPKEEVERGLSYSICSVFVPENKRRLGYAGLMMKLLQENLSPQGEVPRGLEEQEELQVKGSGAVVKGLAGEEGELGDGGKYGRNATCSFLYSDIGEYYSQFGWKVVGNRHIEWAPLSESPIPLPENAQWLTVEDLNSLAKLDRDQLLAELETCSSSSIKFCIDDPNATSWRWLIKRTSFYATTLLSASSAKPSHFGLRIPANDGTGDSYAVWMFDYIERKIAILRLRFTSKEAFEQLIGAVRGQAAKFGMNKCLAWNVDLSSLGLELTDEDEDKLKQDGKVDRLWDELQGGSVVERQGSGASLPALAWYGDKKKGEKVEWVCNEYGWWC